MLKFEMRLTGVQKAAIQSRATSRALKNLFFRQVENETKLIEEKARQNALQLPEAPTGRLASSIRSGFEERGSQLIGSVIADQRVAPYAEFVEFGHFMPDHATWVPGIHYMELAYLEVRRNSKRRIESEMAKGLRWYDQPGAVHRGTRAQLSIV